MAWLNLVNVIVLYEAIWRLEDIGIKMSEERGKNPDHNFLIWVIEVRVGGGNGIVLTVISKL